MWIQREKLTGLSDTEQSVSKFEDLKGADRRTVVEVDLTNRQVTTIIGYPDADESHNAVEIVKNGYLRSESTQSIIEPTRFRLVGEECFDVSAQALGRVKAGSSRDQAGLLDRLHVVVRLEADEEPPATPQKVLPRL